MNNSSTTFITADNNPDSPYRVISEMPVVYVCLLNWNGWRDTIECLESLLKLNFPSCRVMVCDNGSTDESCEQLSSWFASHSMTLYGVPESSASQGEPFLDITREQLELTDLQDQRFVLIRNGLNLGFAAGNNVGLRFALRQADCDFVWLLNNDTVVEPNALQALVDKLQSNPDMGSCGSRLVFYYSQDRIQALGGGVYNPWFALASHVGEHMSVVDSEKLEEFRIDYPCAASMLISRRFLEEVGLMSEDYFLYFEELDWMRRAGRKFRTGYAPGSKVFHKEGQSIGSDGRAAGRSVLSDYYLTRSRFVFTRKYHPYALPTLSVWLVVMMLARIARHGFGDGRFRANLILGAALDGLIGRFRQVSLSKDKPATEHLLEQR